MSSKRLIARYLSNKQDRFEWFLCDSKGVVSSTPEQGTLERLAQASKGKRIIFLVPGRALLLTDVKLPEGSQRALASALPYALEEQLAEDLDNLHIVPASLKPGGKTSVAVIQRQALVDLLNDLSSADIHPHWLVPEPLSLPWQRNTWSLLFEGGRVIVRTGEFSGFECPTELLRPLLSRLMTERVSDRSTPHSEDSTQHQPLNIHGEIPGTLSEVLMADGFTLNFVPEQSASIRSHIGNRRSAIDLLKGFSFGGNSTAVTVNWWPAASMILVALLIFIGVSGYQYWSLQQQLLEKEHQITGLFKDSFPEVKRVVDPLQQARQQLNKRKLAHGKGENPLLTLLYRAGEARQKDRALVFRSVEYRDGILQIRMNGKNVESIERFKQQVENNPGTSVEILSTIVQTTGIEARIKIQGGRS